MFDDAFVVRTEESLSEPRSSSRACGSATTRVGDRRTRARVYNTDLMETVELGFLLDCADTLVAAARDRTESRGGHYREDHPAARRRELAHALARLPEADGGPPGLQAREDGTLHPDGEEVLMATAGEDVRLATVSERDGPSPG